jgi:O-antigen/teichoic acid export membrane protein
MRRFSLWLGIDQAVFFTLLARGWTVAAGLLTIVFVTRFLTLEHQGYYYTFYSLIALQIFAELGLNFAIVQFASHEMAQLVWESEGTVSGSPESKRRLQSLIHFAVTWFSAAALLMVVVLLPVGIYFFSILPPAGTSVPSVIVPWSLLVVFSAINLCISAATAVLEGCGRVTQVAILRFWQSVSAGSTLWIVLSLGGHLYALAASCLMMVMVGSIWLWFKYGIFFKDIFMHRTNLPGINWRREIWPFQWRIAVSWMSGYFIFQLFNPLLFATHGPVAAGQLGMSLQIIMAMNGAALAWITTKMPLFGQLIAQNNRAALDRTFRTALLQSSFFLLSGIAVVLIALLWLQDSYPAYAIRVVPPIYFSALCFVCFANHLVFSEAVYLRAHKEDPFMFLSVVNAITTALLSAFLIRPFGYVGAVAAYSFGAIVIGLLGGTVVFVRKQRELSLMGGQ